MASSDMSPNTVSRAPTIVNMSPIGSRRSSFIAGLPEDDVEYQGEPEHDHAEGGGVAGTQERTLEAGHSIVRQGEPVVDSGSGGPDQQAEERSVARGPAPEHP